MSADGLQNHQKPRGPIPADMAGGLIDQLHHFDGSPEQFLANLLATQCLLSHADSGAILAVRQGQYEVVALFPPLREGQQVPEWLHQSGEYISKAISTEAVIVRPLSDLVHGSRDGGQVLFVSLKVAETGNAAEVFVIKTADQALLEARRAILELTAGLVSICDKRLGLQRKDADLSRLRKAMETLSAVNSHSRFRSIIMGLCNEVASGSGAAAP